MKDEEMAEEYANGYATPDLECSFRAHMFEEHIKELESGACSCCAEDWKHKMLVKLNKENIILKERDTKARKILKPILNEWKETRWVLQSTKSVENIAELMADAEIFLGEVEK